jgi:hypothetical protein
MPDISCVVHQCVRFSAHPKHKHAEVVQRIDRYLLGTQGKGLIVHHMHQNGVTNQP